MRVLHGAERGSGGLYGRMRFGLTVLLRAVSGWRPVRRSPASLPRRPTTPRRSRAVTLKPGEVARVASGSRRKSASNGSWPTLDAPRRAVHHGGHGSHSSDTAWTSRQHALDLRTTPDGEQTAVDGCVVRLTRTLVPLAKAGKRVKDADYRATFVLTAAAAK